MKKRLLAALLALCMALALLPPGMVVADDVEMDSAPGPETASVEDVEKDVDVGPETASAEDVETDSNVGPETEPVEDTETDFPMGPETMPVEDIESDSEEAGIMLFTTVDDHTPPKVTGVYMNNPGGSVTVGDTLYFTVSAEDEYGINIGGAYLQFSSVSEQGHERNIEAYGWQDGSYDEETKQAKFNLTISDDILNGTYKLSSISAWYMLSVEYALDSGLMNGYGKSMFAPNNNLSRAMLAQILYNKEGKPAMSGGGDFTDVSANGWYANAVKWAAENGVVSGYGGGLFGPDDNITREQLAVMLWRYAGRPAPTDKELQFTDADTASGYALDALCWATENGVLNGLGGKRLDPRGLATRAQVAQMLKNYLEN